MKIVYSTIALVCAAVVLLAGPPLAAQADSPPLVDVDTIQIRHLFVEQGLPSLGVWDVTQDSSGFIWIATLDGLARYDGIEFEIFRHDPSNPNSLSNNSLRDLLVDRDGALWVGTTGGGLNRFDLRTEQITRFENDPSDPRSLSHQYVNIIYEDRAGVIWVGTYGGGLNRFDRESGAFTRYQHDPDDPASLSHNDVFGIIEDRSGQLWVATYGGGLSLFHPETGTFTHYRHDPDDPASLSSNTAYTLYEDRAGDLWVGTWGGLNRYDRARDQFIRYLPDPQNPHSLSSPYITTLLEDRAGNLWVGTWGGSLNRLDRATGVFTRYPASTAGTPGRNQLSEIRIRAIHEDQEGMLWIGTESYGLNIIDPYRKPFIVHLNDPEAPDSLVGNGVRALHKDEQGVIWIGTLTGGLYRYDRQTGQVTRHRHDPDDPNSLVNNAIFDIEADGNGALWIGTAGGVSRLDPRSGSFTNYHHDPADANSLSENHVSSVAAGSDGLLWFATYGGLNAFDPVTETFTHYRHDPADATSISSDNLLEVYEDQTGTLWASTEANGLNRFQPATGAFVRYYHNPADPASLSDNTVVSMHEDAEGRLWLATWAGGLNRYLREADAFAHYGAEHGVPQQILCVVEDDAGYLWLNNRSMWGRFDPNSGASVRYDYRDGLPAKGGTINACLRGAPGELIFGSADGLVTFYPDQIRPSLFVPPVVFTGFYVEHQPATIGPGGLLEQSINDTDHITLARTVRTIAFDFAALSYRFPAGNRYRYWLEGFDTDWQEVGSDRRSATYTNLAPGTYTFHVTGSNNDGIWNESGRALTITILPAWWETIGFRLFVIGAMLACVAGVYRLRTALYRARNRDLEAQVALRTAEIATLLDVTQTVSSILELSHLLDFILKQLRKIVAYDAAGILELENNTLMVQAITGAGSQALSLPHPLPLAKFVLLRQLVFEGRAVYVPDLRANVAEMVDLLAEVLSTPPERLPETAGCWLGIPLIHKGTVIGALFVTQRQVNAYTAHDQELAQAFANQMAYAIANARLHEQAQQVAAEAERHRINRDLHDSLSQTLFAAKMTLRGLPSPLDKNLDKASAQVADLKELIGRAESELRALLTDTRPEYLSTYPLNELISQLGESFRLRGKSRLLLELEDTPVLSANIQQTYYYIAQETLHNSLQHARAKNTKVKLGIKDGWLVLNVSDNGCGFDTTRSQPGHYGLTIMRERARDIGAELQITSQPGAGTQLELTCRIPGPVLVTGERYADGSKQNNTGHDR